MKKIMHLSKISHGALLGAFLLAFGSSALHAQNTTQSVTPVSSDVVNACVIRSTDNISFGTYDPMSVADLTSSGAIQLTCTKAAIASVVPVSGGRQMSGMGGTLQYALYSDSSMSKTWAQASILPMELTATNDGNKQLYFEKISGWIPGHLTVAQLQTLFPTFDPSSTYLYSYNKNVFTGGMTQPATLIFFGYLGQGPVASRPPGSFSSGANVSAAFVGDPYSFGVTQTVMMPAGAYKVGNVYQVPGPGNPTPLSATSSSAQAPIIMPYYARLAAKQDVLPGAYTDQMMFQVNF